MQQQSGPPTGYGTLVPHLGIAAFIGGDQGATATLGLHEHGHTMAWAFSNGHLLGLLSPKGHGSEDKVAGNLGRAVPEGGDFARLCVQIRGIAMCLAGSHSRLTSLGMFKWHDMCPRRKSRSIWWGRGKPGKADARVRHRLPLEGAF